MTTKGKRALLRFAERIMKRAEASHRNVDFSGHYRLIESLLRECDRLEKTNESDSPKEVDGKERGPAQKE